LKTERTTISMAVPMVTPTMLMSVSVEIRDMCFLANR